MADSNWKTRIGVEINYSSGQSSDEDDIEGSVIERKWKGLDELAAEYDYLGSTPPRTRIRNKERHKSNSGENNTASPKITKVVRRNTVDTIMPSDIKQPDDFTEKKTKRKLLKFLRGHDRDIKLNIGKCRTCRTESMPNQSPKIIIPTLVESCNRFMSLCSKPVCPVQKGSSTNSDGSKSVEDQADDSSSCQEPQVPDNRALFHDTFSMLIRMGNADKHCKRAISVEEHTWQNELKDLVWLEVCAKRAGRTNTQQDAFLCSRRDSVPALLQSVLNYRFKNTEVKCTGAAVWTTQFSVMSLDSGHGNSSPSDSDTTPLDGPQGVGSASTVNPLDTITEHLAVKNNDLLHSECLCVECPTCSKAVGAAMRQVVTLLDAISDAEALYPSCKAMALQHPIVTSEEYIDKLKALCLWYNMVHHQRLKLLIIRQLLFTERWKDLSKNKTKTASEKETVIKENGVNHGSHQSKVKFTDEKSSNGENSSTIELDIARRKISGESQTENEECDQSDDDNDVQQAMRVQIEITQIQSTDTNLLESIDEVDGSVECRNETLHHDLTRKDKLIEVTADQSRSPYESAESSSGSVNSNESGFGSSVNDNQDEGISQMINKFNVFDLGNLGGLTHLRLYQPNQTSPYRDHIEKMLKSRGIRSALYFLEKLHLGVLKKTRMTLEKYEDIKAEEPLLNNEGTKENDSPAAVVTDEENNSDDDFEYERHMRCDVDIKELKKEYIDLRRFGAWSKEAVHMRLPSYRGIFLFLSTLPMENIHEFLSMKLETKPEKPSLLSLKQLINELREGLTIAVRMRSRFVRHTQTALNVEPENSKCWKFHHKVIDTFDKTVDEVYKLYLSYLSDWAGIEYLPRSTLAAEWAFNAYLARSLRSAATLAPLTFCCLTVRQLENAATRLKKRATELGQTADLLSERPSEEESDSCDTIKIRILRVCREMQCLLTEERESALSTAQFARTVSAHLHHNAIFRNYRQKMFTAMANVQSVLCWTIGRMQETASPQRLKGLDEQDRPSVQSRTREIVSQAYKFGFEFHKEMGRLINDNLSPENIYNPCARNSLTHGRRPKLVRSESINENHPSLEDNCYTYNPFTPTVNGAFTYPANNSKARGLSIEDETMYKSVSKNPWILRSRKFPSFDTVAGGTLLADLNQDDFKGGIPGCEECHRGAGKDDKNCVGGLLKDAPSCDWPMTVSRGLVQFAKQWMSFAMERCERGRGLRPRWANHGLEFLILTCDPRHTKHLSTDEFEELKTMMDSCISHVIGSKRSAGVASMSTPLVHSTPTLQRSRSSLLFSQHSLNKSLQSSTPSVLVSEPDFTTAPIPDETVRHGKQVAALYELDCRRDDFLRKASTIGSVRRGDGSREHFRPRPVTFKWQRGIKIGQGRFGKVYTVVNTESGQLLAMKEVSLGIGDRRAVERAANELKVLEGVVHPNLVRYYGVEIHREEMLIFMELCVEGSLESLIARCGAKAGSGEEGLLEQQVRRYTRQLVAAVRALHSRSIAHRDIKSGNIFLTEEGNCLKLGDFGCAVKIRANTTVPGELQGYIGTQAYMAPEVFMKSGHGRGADIWSLGCVVVEMSSGKRPWSEYDSNYQIMFVVGMGQRPEPPAHLSTEGEDFCLSCLQHDPAQRADIDTLTHHPFIQGAQ